MKYSDDDLRSKAQATVDAFARAYNRKHGSTIPVPVELTFDLELKKPKCAGMAIGDTRVELNMTLYRDNTDVYLNEVIPHEVAHLAQASLNAKGGDHSPQWRKLMESMFRRARKHHTMDTRKAVAVYDAYKAANRAMKRKAAR